MAAGRELALNALLENEKGAFSNSVIDETIKAHPELIPEERAFFTRLVEGVIENRIYLDHVINSVSTTKINKMKPVIRNILRLGVYQILFMDKVPDSAAVSESVKLAIKRKFTGLKGFVNGVLRNIVREKEKAMGCPENADALDKISAGEQVRNSFLSALSPDAPEYISVKYSLPLWIVEKWTADYGTEKTRNMAEGIMGQKPLHVWLATSKMPEEKILERLAEEGIEAVRDENLPDTAAFYLQNISSPAKAKAFSDGLFYIQDAASTIALNRLSFYIQKQLAALRLVPAFLDVCAAPGGKTLFLADAFPQAHIVCRDLSEKKIDLIIDNVRRLGFENVYPEVQDASVFKEEDREAYDVVVADLPCSGLGVLGRKSDIRYRVQPEDLSSLQTLQRKILTQVTKYVKPGGLFLYSTCTVNRGENEENAAWIAEKTGMKLLEEKQLFPEKEPYHDGFYYAIFER